MGKLHYKLILFLFIKHFLHLSMWVTTEYGKDMVGDRGYQEAFRWTDNNPLYNVVYILLRGCILTRTT